MYSDNKSLVCTFAHVRRYHEIPTNTKNCMYCMCHNQMYMYMYMYIYYYVLLSSAITVAVEGNKVVTLPQNSLKVFGSSWPNEQGYHYEWNKVGGPASGELVGIHEKILEMNNVRLHVYIYMFCSI